MERSKRTEEFGHLSRRVGVTDSARDRDAGCEQRLRSINLVEPSQQLSPLKVSGDVIRILGDELLKVLLSDVGVTIGGAGHRQTVTQERVLGFGGEKLFQLCAS